MPTSSAPPDTSSAQLSHISTPYPEAARVNSGGLNSGSLDSGVLDSGVLSSLNTALSLEDSAPNADNDPRRQAKHLLYFSVPLAVCICGLSFGLASLFNLVDVDDRVPFTGSVVGSEISLVAEFLKVDSDARTLTVDWYPLAFSCSAPDTVVNIFFDHGERDGPKGSSPLPNSVPGYGPLRGLNAG
ncbi:hypothetical protein B0H13DRAFT_1867976 [Mycena leptocephala]|nr:hypothetical protein B0H13DRAFT_1867976 [Mycena leptocephala]